MVTGGRGDHAQPSSGCRIRCIHLVLLLECLLFSIGTASPPRKEIGDSVVNIDNSLTAADKVHNSLNFHPALQESEVYPTQQDSFFPKISTDSHSKPSGLLSFLRRFVAELCRTSPVLDSWPAEKIMVQLMGSTEEDSQVTSSSTGSSNRRIGPGYYSDKTRRSPSSRRCLWAELDQHQQQQQEQEQIMMIDNEGRRVLQEETTVSSPALPQAQTQVVHLGPPAPPDLLNNEKQDWNQDYAEPDVHPPSSN
ncbi:unnamed protein product [Calypogeia fissa]